MASVTVRIPTTAHERARRLAENEKTTLASVIDVALERYERERMAAAYLADMERLAADPVAWADWQAEIAELEGTMYDGLAEYPYEGIEDLVEQAGASRE
jgi:hypothetical protein